MRVETLAIGQVVSLERDPEITYERPNHARNLFGWDYTTCQWLRVHLHNTNTRTGMGGGHGHARQTQKRGCGVRVVSESWSSTSEAPDFIQ